MLTRVSSAMPTTETSDDALSSRMNSLMSGGIEMRSACGSRMRRQMSRPAKPSAAAASRLPARHGVERAAQDLRLIGGRRQREAADRRHDRRHVEAEFGEEIVDEQQLHQQRHAAEQADIGRAEALEPVRRESRAAQTSRADRRSRTRCRRTKRRPSSPAACVEIAERMEDDLRLHRGGGGRRRRGAAPRSAEAVRSSAREPSWAGPSSGRTRSSGSSPSCRRPRP